MILYRNRKERYVHIILNRIIKSKRLSYLLICLLLCTASASAQLTNPLRDNQGRHVVPRGFVVITNDHIGDVYYHLSDYQRMARLGANYQVIRVNARELPLDDVQQANAYLARLDSLVDLGRKVGMKTVMKMTIYGIKKFSWERFWTNEDNIQDVYVDRWKLVFDYFKDNFFVSGYDLLNEPRKKSLKVSYNEITEDYLFPFYEKLIDEANKYDKTKSFYCQSIYLNKEDRGHDELSIIRKPINRKHVILTPHLYQWESTKVGPQMNMNSTNAQTMKAKMLVGEWGIPTLSSSDSTIEAQLDYKKLYMRTLQVFDSLGCGAFKAWFAGTRKMMKYMHGEPYTWCLFRDNGAVGSYERKYIMDIIAHPYPQIIAGDIYRFNFDFPTRKFTVSLKPDNSKGASFIYLCADRYYQDGFVGTLSDGTVLSYDPLIPNRIEVVKCGDTFQANDVVWDSSKQRIIFLRWPKVSNLLTIKITPGLI